MRFIHKQAVHAELLKGDNIIFPACFCELFQPGLDTLFRFLQALDSEILRVAVSKLFQSRLDLGKLFFQQSFLSLL